MRISDLLMSSDYLNNLSKVKENVTNLQNLIATGTKINSPSDSPVGTANLLGWNNQLSQTQTYSGNIDSGLSFLQNTTDTMDSIQNNITTVLTKLTQVQNVANTTNLNSYADQVDQILNSLVNQANTNVDGKYIFGGTDFSAAPFSLASDGSSVQVAPNDISGTQSIRTSQSTTQKINMTGTEIFGTIVKLDGTIDSGTAVGGSVTKNTNVYDSSGNQYTLNTTFTKTAANTYDMTYDVVDGGGTSIFSSPPAAKSVVFDSTSGNIKTVNGQPASDIHIKDTTKKIDFSLNFLGVAEKSSATTLAYSANQKNDIFNTLIQIRDTLKSGKTPTADQVQAVSDFNSRLLDNITKAGNITNQLTDSQDLLSNRQTQLNTMISNEQGVDLAKAITDLQNQNNTLQLTYKIASSTVTDSLLNYL